MNIQNEIQKHLEEVFDIQFIELKNESYMHNVPAGSEFHFKLVLVSDAFIRKSLVQRHQIVYTILAKQMTKIHALAMHLYTQAEWSERHNKAPISPDCQGRKQL